MKLEQKIFSLLDLTSLNETDNEKVISTLCHHAHGSLGSVAAVCVYPSFVKQAADALVGTPVKIATVANFPHGNEALESVISTIKTSLANGAQEIDLVFPYQRYLAGEKIAACDVITTCKKLCGNHTLKVILETGLLQDLNLITEVSQDVIAAGADFLKTSTGKVAIGATVEAATAMLAVIKKSTRPVGFKASGGIRTLGQAMQYIHLAEEMIGFDWVMPSHFRLGASRLIVDL